MSKGTMGTEEQIPEYLAYLLRLWRMRGEGPAGWRASLAYPGDGEHHGFASLDELFLFLRRRTGTESDDEGLGAEGNE
jgi:hypothetical protein